MVTGVEVFVSYSHKDERFREQLDAHLSQLRNEGVVADWNDRKILPGDDWAGEIDKHVESADIILLLISSDFLASKYCVEIEMKRALERHAAGEARVIPIIVRPADWQTAQFAHLQAVPKDSRPITKWGNRDEAWVSVTKGIRGVTKEIRDAASKTADDKLSMEPDWRQKLDRIEQTGTARYLIGDMLKYGHPQCICFCWYGGEKDGVALFHNRLENEFDVESGGRCWSVQPAWPGVVNRSGFREMLRQTFDGQGDIGTAVRQHFRGRQERRHLLYVNHSPVESSKRLSPQQFLEYLRWWDEEVLDYLEPQQCVVLGVSFLVNNPVQFKYAVEKVAGIPAHPFSDRFVFKFLPVLEKLEADDIRTAFKRMDMQSRFAPEILERAVTKLISDTSGEYDVVVRELEVLIESGFAKFAELEPVDTPDETGKELGY